MPLEDFRIMHTADGGRSWETQLTVPATGQLLQICQNLRGFDAENAFALLRDKLYRTTDGGSSWQDITPSIPGFVLQQMSFISAGNGWVSGNLNSGTAAVYKTSDAGATWSAQWRLTDIGLPGDTSELEFINANDGWILLNNGPEIIAYLYRTTDGGKSFTRLTEIRSGRPYVTGLVFTGENTGWLTTDHGAGPVAGGIAGTVDGGRTFTYIVGGDGGIDDIGAVDYIAFPSAKTGFAVCSGIEDSICLLKTEDSGKAWRQISPVKPRNGISFPDKDNGFGIGTDFTSNRVLRTQDGGATWNPITVPDTGSAPVGLSFIDRQTDF